MKEAWHIWGQKIYMQTSVASSQFCYEPNTAVKIVYLKIKLNCETYSLDAAHGFDFVSSSPN